jgi:hypothetical protein
MSASEHYVPTGAIRDAVRGREMDVLRAMGIQWNGRSNHIRCPYPDHPDHEPSWRWDDKRKVAFCSCIGTRLSEKKVHDIFGVVGAKEGLDFKAAKMRVAEIIGRPDLIIESNTQKYQRSDALSLLNPSPENRDDALALRYLGNRLNVETERVPRPATKLVGLKSLAYFDPPPGANAKPVHVGDFPAAVFETLHRDGKRHAHRIYLAPGGAEKAELGLASDGQRRKPKKSAKKTANESTSGCSVIWGDPSNAETEIIVEGIETGAAVALAFGSEITSGKVAVAACITAYGLETFKHWPAAKHIIVGADRDEVSKDAHPPTRRGEIAAQKFARLHHREIAVSIALPGTSGEKVDWLDVLRREGIDSVRAGILAAVPFEWNSGDNPPNREHEHEKQADVIIRLARTSAQLFHGADGTAFVDVRVGNHRETWPVRSRGFRLWLTREYYKDRQSAPNSDAMQCALNVLEAIARFDGSEEHVSVRIGGMGGKIYIDLGNKDWSAIEIDSDGWRIVAEPPVRFRRSKGMLALPIPRRGGNINVLRAFLNLKTDVDFLLVVSWLVAALRNRGPYPVLVLIGEHGTAKSTLTRVLRALVDPNSTSLRSLPRDDRDLFISANNGYVMAFDNVSKLLAWLSDSLARLATGGGYATRELYTDSEVSLFDAMRPTILNGIEDFVTRGDLADRVVTLNLMEISDDRRRDEETFWSEFDSSAPFILGALLDAVACGLKRLPEVKLERLPRMADFAKWVVACEGSLPWSAGAFMRAYDSNRAESVETTLESDLIAMAVRKLLAEQSEWNGTAGDLLKVLNAIATEERHKAENWPKTPRGMSGALRRVAPGLRKLRYTVELGQRDTNQERKRLIRLCTPVDVGQGPSGPSEPSERFCDSHFNTDGRADDRSNTQDRPSDRPSVSNPLKQKVKDGPDDVDERILTLTGDAHGTDLAEAEI